MSLLKIDGAICMQSEQDECAKASRTNMMSSKPDSVSTIPYEGSKDPFASPRQSYEDSLKPIDFTIEQYLAPVKDLPTISNDWIPDSRALGASPYLKHTLERIFSGYAVTEIELASAWYEIKFPVRSMEHMLVSKVQETIGYQFANERLLYQAFTRRSYAKQNGTYADNEALEYLGDSMLTATLNRLMFDQYSRFTTHDRYGNLLVTEMTEGQMTRVKINLTNKDYLAKRCIELGFDRYILFGDGDYDDTMDPKEDLMEAIFGAAAIDCDYDYDTLGALAETLLDLHLTFDAYESIPDAFVDVNVWCERRFKCKPVYKLQKRASDAYAECIKGKSTAVYDCTLTIPDPGYPSNTVNNDVSGNTGFPATPEKTITFTAEGPTRSTARTYAAQKARNFLEDNGYWLNIADSGIEPQLDLAINQLQELYQKKYIDKAEYAFSRDGRVWMCTCRVENYSAEKYGYSKPEAKKKAAYAVLVYLMRSSGLYDFEWYKILGEDAPYYMDELILFNQEHPGAEIHEKYEFVLRIQNEYDTIVAKEKFQNMRDEKGDKIDESVFLNGDGSRHYEYLQEIGIAHRNIGISLCKAMLLDYDDFYYWKRSSLGRIERSDSARSGASAENAD